MKRSICRILIFIALGWTVANVYALDNTSYPQDYARDFFTRDVYNYGTVSARVSDMFRYGEFQTSLFTGRMQVTIPIYTFDDPDFKINIALHYNAEGFKPRKHSGYVGYNWFLEAGGCITREVNGYPDEIIGHSDHNKNYGANYPGLPGVKGMYYYITRTPGANNLDKNDIFELPLASNAQACNFLGNYWHNIGDSCDYEVDYMPDIFHFNFLGYKGRFMINNAGQVQVIGGDYVDVDLSGIIADWEPQCPTSVLGHSMPMYPKENSCITIRTTDGYTYIFGGDLSALEYTVNVHNAGEFLPSSKIYDCFQLNPPTVSTWYLTGIIAPNNRKVAFYYKPVKKPVEALYVQEEIPTIPLEDDPLWEFNEYYNRYDKYYRASDGIYSHIYNKLHGYAYNGYTSQELIEYYSILDMSVIPYIPNVNSFYLHSATKTCILDSISVSGEQPLKIIFDNSLESRAMYDPAYLVNSRKNFQLNNIRILSSDQLIKKAHFSYMYKNSSGAKIFNWRFLNSVNINGVGNYQMDYYDGYFPDLSYKSQNYDKERGESDEMDDYGYYVNPNCSIALLQKFTYPTGGYQTYLYEPYRFNKKRMYRMRGDSIVEMSTTNYNGSKRGARIKEVKTFEKDDRLVETTSYTYSNGIFYDNLRVYGLYNEYDTQYGWPVRFRANYGLSSHIGYGQVKEEVTNTQGDKYKTIYQFDTGEDSYMSQNDSDMLGTYPYNNLKFGVLTGTMSYGNKLKKWGELTSVNNYDSNNRLLRSTRYEYNDMSEGRTDTVVIFFHDCRTEISKKLYLSPDVLIKKITIDYSQGDSLETTNSYSYDLKLRVKRETVEDSQGILRFTKYTYPDEVKLSANLFNEPPLRRLVKANRISTPVETVAGYIQGDKEYVISGNINLYATGAYGVIVSNNTNSPAHISPFPYPGADSIFTDTVPMWPHDPYIDLVYYPYLHKSMSLTLSTPLTDYQPMAADGDDITYDSRYRLSCEYNFDWMYRPVSIKPFGKTATTYTWNGIYPVTKTIGNQTWTYTYKPHVGLETMTDPRGITTYYTYDSAGRLIEEYQLVNGKKQILHVYQYHIKTE